MVVNLQQFVITLVYRELVIESFSTVSSDSKETTISSPRGLKICGLLRETCLTVSSDSKVITISPRGLKICGLLRETCLTVSSDSKVRTISPRGLKICGLLRFSLIISTIPPCISKMST